MFFYIGNTSPLSSLNQVEEGLYLDKGWTQLNDVWLKGYSTDCVLSDNIDRILDGYQPRGKWCVIHNKKIYHPALRGFPLFQRESDITNIDIDGFQYVMYDLLLPENTESLSIDEAATIVGDILLENTQNFLKFNNPKNLTVIFTAGLDSTTSWAVLDSITTDYRLEIYPYDPTTEKFSEYKSDLIDHMRKKLWSYGLTRYHTNTNWLVTGFYSERMQMREVTNGEAIFSYLKKDTFDIVKENDYLYWFLKRPRQVGEYHLTTEKEVKDWCYRSILNDHQGWHLDNNFQFSPFFDSRITDTMYRLSLDDIILNLRTGYIQRKIIERFNPDLLQIVADYKNSLDIYANFRKNWNCINISPKVDIMINENSARNQLLKYFSTRKTHE